MVQEARSDSGRMWVLPPNSPLRSKGYKELNPSSVNMGEPEDRRVVGNRKGLLKSRLNDVEDALRHKRCIVNHGFAVDECADCCNGRQGHGIPSLRFELDELRRQLVVVQKLIDDFRDINKWEKAGF